MGAKRRQNTDNYPQVNHYARLHDKSIIWRIALLLFYWECIKTGKFMV